MGDNINAWLNNLPVITVNEIKEVMNKIFLESKNVMANSQLSIDSLLVNLFSTLKNDSFKIDFEPLVTSKDGNSSGLFLYFYYLLSYNIPLQVFLNIFIILYFEFL